MSTKNSFQIVPTALTVRRSQSQVTVGATPSLPQALGNGDLIRVEVCNEAGKVVWHDDYPADRVREQLSGSSRAVTVEIPTANLPDGCYLLRFHDLQTTPFFVATLEVTLIDES